MDSNFKIIFLITLSFISTKGQSIDESLQNCRCLGESQTDLNEAINKSTESIHKLMVKHMIPGLSVGVSRSGRQVWVEAFGLSDIENDVPVYKDSVWRMGSISKVLTGALIGRLMDKGLVDLDQSIHTYVSTSVLPVKQWKGRNVSITLGQVMSHTAGLRVTDIQKDFVNIHEYKNVTDTIAQFRDEPLLSAPGTQYNYSNFGYQVVGAVIESVMNQSFDKAIDEMLKEIELKSTFCEKQQMIIRHKVHDYMTSDVRDLLTGKTSNNSMRTQLKAMLVDDLLSFEAQWSAGALVSTSEDLLTFGNFMLNSYKGVNNHSNSGYLSSSTVRKLWEPVIDSYKDDIASHKSSYGWGITELDKPIKCENKCKLQSTVKKIIWKTGGMTGVETVIVILPDQDIIATLFVNSVNLGFNIIRTVVNIAINFMI